jgi:hypothetical protein
MGIIIALSIIVLWAIHLAFMLSYLEFSVSNPWMYLHILLQGYLYTGLFITGHDAMHGTVAPNKTLNKMIGAAAIFLFAGMSYNRLKKNHLMHHRFPALTEDPDFFARSQNFWAWWGVFMWRYLTPGQIIIMAAAYNVLFHIVGLDDLKGAGLLGITCHHGHSAAFLFWSLPATSPASRRLHDAAQGTHPKQESLLGYAELLFFRIPLSNIIKIPVYPGGNYIKQSHHKI